ncbi:hypothetical protein QBC47DRAFT_350706 [Echria macrotheca]|uniref:MOZ protein represents a chromatin-associated acetyltransferase n=1 Tax=Echria macrotheca TaxID=438768 RepID=A0AAJ0B4L7_9PEZI|nr:hypothetical protein QBC47DRAFT_350706 [Echria macrotheca]
MASSRLTFLYPHLCRTGRWSEPAASQIIISRTTRRRPTTSPPTLSCQHAAPFTTPSAGRQAPFPKRAGKAVEPLPLPALETSQTTTETNKPASEPTPEDQRGAQQDKTQDAGSNSGNAQTKSDAKTNQPEPNSNPEAVKSASETPRPDPPPPPKTDEKKPEDLGTKTKGTSGPMDAILHMEPPSSSSSGPSVTFDFDSTKDPSSLHSAASKLASHLHPPPYVHHFDSYSLVKQLESGGYTHGQAITAMKAVRGLLASNLDVAQASLVSKSDVENETYLFKAACSELSTEVKNNRRVADEHLRQQRTLLQHEADILTQQLNQELAKLNDSVRGMFNDRRMAVREEQKAVDSRIQQISYKITVMLNSDAKSEIEGLRWVLIRRSVLGIVFMAILTLGTLRYGTHVNHEKQKKAEREAREREREAEEGRKPNGKLDTMDAPQAAEILAAS